MTSLRWNKTYGKNDKCSRNLRLTCIITDILSSQGFPPYQQEVILEINITIEPQVRIYFFLFDVVKACLPRWSAACLAPPWRRGLWSVAPARGTGDLCVYRVYWVYRAKLWTRARPPGVLGGWHVWLHHVALSLNRGLGWDSQETFISYWKLNGNNDLFLAK